MSYVDSSKVDNSTSVVHDLSSMSPSLSQPSSAFGLFHRSKRKNACVIARQRRIDVNTLQKS